MTTNELISIWEKNNQTSQSQKIFDEISEVLTKRNSTIPVRTKFQTKSVNLPMDCNASVKMVGPTKSEIIFPKDGYMRVGVSKFNNEKEIKAYVAGAFLTDNESSIFHGTIRRSGKYVRIDEKGNAVFTFGDPVLDSITNEKGEIIISGKVHDIKWGHPAARRGGISSIDLKKDLPDIRKYQLTHSLSGKGGFTLLERNDKITTIASSNPSEIWFYEDGTNNSMRFRTFKHNYWKYHSIGCEIETWGGSDAHFSSASITSWYGQIDLLPWCSFLKADSDSDTNDDFVDEYEWGVNAVPADGVQSSCVANWRNMEKNGTVYDTCEKFGGLE